MANVIIPQDFHDYLTESGYYKHFTNHHGSVYVRGDQRVILIDDRLIYDEMNEGSDDHNPYWTQIATFSGVTHVDFFGYALILHAIGAVSIKDNIRKTNHIPAPAYPVNPLFETLERFAI